MKNIQVALACCLAAIIMPASAGESAWQMQMSAGNAANDKGDYASAEEHYTVALQEAEFSHLENPPDLVASLDKLAALYLRQGRYAKAEPLYNRCLAILEKLYGPEHFRVSESLDRLAFIYKAQARYAEAELFYKRNLAIREKNNGPEDIVVAIILSDLAQLYLNQGRYAEADPIFKRILVIWEKELGPEHPDLSLHLYNLASLYDVQGKYADAEPLHKRSLTILEKSFGPEHQQVANSLHNLAEHYHAQGRYSIAEPLYKRSLAIRERDLGVEHPDVVATLNSLALLYKNQGRYGDAVPFLERTLTFREKSLGPEHFLVAESLNNLAVLYRSLGRYAEAESLYKRSLAIIEKSRGSESIDVSVSLHNLAGFYRYQGRMVEAEPLYKRSLVIMEKAYGYEHPLVTKSLNGLAMLYVIQGRYTEAEPLFKRSLAILEKSFGLEHPSFALTLGGLASLYESQDRHEEAETLYKRSLDIREKALGPEHPDVAASLSNLGLHYIKHGRFAEAEPLLKRCLGIDEKTHGPEHPDFANSLEVLAGLYEQQGRYAEAEQLFMRSLKIMEKTLGPEHRAVANTLFNIATLYNNQDHHFKALPYYRRSIKIFTNSFNLKEEPASGGVRALQRSRSWRFEDFIAVLMSAGSNAGTPDAIAAESFEVAQWARANNTAEQVAKMAARHAAGSDALAKVARERQDLLANLQKLEADLIAEVSKPADQRSAERDLDLRQSEADAKNQLHALDERIARKFPRYGELTQPKPLTIAEAQKLLASDEALLLWLVGEKESYLWAVRRERATFHKIALPRDELDAALRLLRQHLDLGASSDPARLLAKPFDAASAHDLYLKLLSPADGLLKGVKHLILVPDGPLQSLPPAVLVTEAPKTPVDHRDAAWLVKKYALTVLPSANSLRALRAFAGRVPGKDPLIGFGNPVLEGSGETAETKSRGRRVPAGLVSRGAVADPKEVRKMDPLPNTADELKRIAASLNAPAGALHLGAHATEARVKQIDLSHARVLAFATHGLMAEEFQGLAEPALVLTPPAEASAQDDGLLTASEISQLRLNADWVVLSACNTAASDGKPGAEGLSGLARAFFYAGARTLMVSHWAVETNSSAALTTGAFAQSSKGLRKAEALRQSMLALMGRKDFPHADHPALWAPFVIVGEGGTP